MNIRNKLISYTIGTILITLTITGFAIDLILTSLYKNNARAELNFTYTNFINKINLINDDIIAQSTQISSEKSVIALANLVHRYEDRNNYQPLIFDNDKKKVATFLLKEINLSEADRVMIYAKDGSLIAFATQSSSYKLTGFNSFENSKPIYYINDSHSNNWKNKKLPQNIIARIPPLKKYYSFLSHTGRIDYFTRDNEFIAENSRIISRTHPNGSIEVLGVVRTSKSLDENFFKFAIKNTNTKISIALENNIVLNNREQLFPIKDLASSSLLFGDEYKNSDSLLTNKKYFIQSFIWSTTQGNNYLLISLPKSGLVSALNTTRLYLFVIFSFIAIVIIIIGIYWLNRLVSKPLNALVKQAEFNESNNYPHFIVRSGDDEISKLSTVLNTMVSTIHSREKDLTIRTKKLNNAQHIAKVGDWELDLSNDKMYWSDETYNIFGFTQDTCTPSVQKILSIMHPDDIEKSQQIYDEAMLSKLPFDFTHRILSEDKSIRHIHVNGEYIYDDSGNAIRSVGTTQDITDQVLKDEQLRRTQKMDALGKLTGGVAHDFNNMLGIIMGFTELLRDSIAESDTKKIKYSNEILQAAERARKLTSKLLSFSRKDTPTACSANINQLLLAEQHMLEKTLTVRIQLDLELADDLWDVWIDKDELEDAIVNMSINAMHAIDAMGKLTFTTQNISLGTIDVQNMEIPAGDYVLLSITDTGKGMDSDTLTHIFEPFFTTKNEKGTGLGMSQVYGFIQRSSGTINIYSELGYGTRISIYLPRYINSEEKTLQSLPINKYEDLSGSSSVLIVDDEPALRALTSEILTTNGYRVHLAESGKKALELLKNHAVDIVISDVIMPEMNGYELAKEIKRQYPHIKIQMASGFSDIQDFTIEDEELHFNRLQKPFSSKILLQRIKQLLTQSTH